MSGIEAQLQHNGMARCAVCKEPTVPVLIGTVAEVEADPVIVIRCAACAVIEEAEAITGERRKGAA